MNNGTAASFQDNLVHGEDAFIIRELSSTASLDAVLDGVTHCEGGYASGFTAQLLQEAPIKSLDDLIDALEQANQIMFQSGKGRKLLTTVSAVLKTGDELEVINVGDSSGYLIRGGAVSELVTIVKSGLLTSLASGAVGLHGKLTYEYKKVTLQPGDRLVMATDGLINNVFPEELLDIVQRIISPHKAALALEELVRGKRRLHIGRQDSYVTFREDDQTAIIRYFD